MTAMPKALEPTAGSLAGDGSVCFSVLMVCQAVNLVRSLAKKT
jgi:hypothetical protein